MLLAWSIAVAVALGLHFAGFGTGIEHQMANMRADLLEKPASGDIAIVEIDAGSIQALENWPWPREHYGALVDKLSDAGVAQIAFDIDFSSRSTSEQDRMFADSLNASRAAIILPTFKQKSSSANQSYTESLPAKPFRDNAFLASVNVHPDQNGQLNTYSFGTTTGGVARPSLASMLAETSGHIGESFAIDQSIDPATIPRYSFADILESNGSDLNLAGKKILVGATAIELGDRYPMSRFGIMPGVVIQAMAAETLLQGSNIPHIGFWPPLILAMLILTFGLARNRSTQKRVTEYAIATTVILFAALLLSEYFALFSFSNIPAFFFIGTLLVAEKILKTNFALKTTRLQNTISQLPNEAALRECLSRQHNREIASAKLTDYRELLVVTTEQSRIDLFQNLADRFKYLAEDEIIYHLDTDIIGWVVKKDYVNDLANHFDTAAALLQAPVMADGTKIKLNTAFGISDSSIDKAKIAAGQAQAGGKRWARHDEDAALATSRNQNLLADLEQAIKQQDIWVVYQPKWDLADDRLCGAEALVRWKHREYGNVSPEIFVPLLEKAGRVDELTLYVLKMTLANVTNWAVTHPHLSYSVNISAQLLGDSEFIRTAIGLVNEADIDNHHIIFEMTETATLADPELSIDALEQVREAGIKVSIDDYGTGQSTMSYLQRLPVDEIKIDQSFVKTMMSDNANQLMVKSTIELAHALNLKVVAEGIEDKDCMDQLKTFGCDVAQGWHISKAVSTEAFMADWLDISGSQNLRRSA